MAKAPPFWTGELGPVLLRAMYDVEITVAWIMKVPQERARKYIDYGLGQEKLYLEHRRNPPAGIEPLAGEDLVYAEAWLNTQRSPWFTAVNVGAWADIPTRRMAEEAGIKDVYDLKYMPASAIAHSAWNFVGKYNLRRCGNPLHRYHRIPVVQPQDHDFMAVNEAAETLDRTFRYTDGWSAERPWTAALGVLEQELGEMAERIQKEREENGTTKEESEP
jgi:hypothetical protein